MVEVNTLKNEVILGLVQHQRQIWKRGSGRNLHKSLEEDFKHHNIKIGRDKFLDFLRDHKLLIRPKRFRAKTTSSFHHFNKFDYLIKDRTPTRKNEIWVSDITYIWLRQKGKFCYLSLITDLYSRKIVGYCLHKDLTTHGCIEALEKAIAQRENTDENLIHHSDRGVEYCSHEYIKLLKKNIIEISMTQTSDPLENAVAERINKTIKEEFTTERQMSFRSLKNAKESMDRIIDFYNTKRPHRSVEWYTPNNAHQKTGILKRQWKTYYKKQESQINNANKND
jgi:putative transposase